MLVRATVIAAALLAARGAAQNFTVSNGQIFTPGFAILDAPQPGTPEGGDTLEVALDVSADGKLDLPPYADNSPSAINNITIFLYSYDTGRNFTISNGTATAGNGSLGPVMAMEPGSTVKHVKWTWPDCLVGDGTNKGSGPDRGVYNISIRQNFRLNSTNYYTVFDVPISVTNSIPSGVARPNCNALNNQLLSWDTINKSANWIRPLFAPGESTIIETNTTASGGNSGSGSGSGGSGKGGGSPGEPTQGAASAIKMWKGAIWIVLGSVVFAVAQ